MTFDMVFGFGIGMLVGCGFALATMWMSFRSMVWLLKCVVVEGGETPDA